MTHFMKVYFHSCQYMLTAYFRKMLSFEMHFYQTFGFSMFSNNCLNTSKKKTDLLFCFGFRDSRVIIVTFWPSFESAENKFISCHITITYTRSAVFTTYRSQNYVKKFHGHHMLSLSLSADADPESFDSDNVFFIYISCRFS